jgi:hypothetical protein
VGRHFLDRCEEFQPGLKSTLAEPLEGLGVDGRRTGAILNRARKCLNKGKGAHREPGADARRTGATLTPNEEVAVVGSSALGGLTGKRAQGLRAGRKKGESPSRSCFLQVGRRRWRVG